MPEGPPAALPVAKITDRFLAYLIDTLPFGIGYFLSAGFLIGVVGRLPNAPGSWRELAACWLGLYVLYHTLGNRAGSTLGKALMGLRVVSIKDAAPPDLAKSAARAFGLLLSTPFNLGFLWAFADKDSRTWHDKLAGTMVVEARPKTASESRLTALAAFVSLGALLVVAVLAQRLRPTRADAEAVVRAQQGLQVLASIEEKYKAANGEYTKSLADLASASGDAAQFKNAMMDLFEPRQFRIAATSTGYTLSGRALDRHRSVVTLSGPVSAR
ncbi:MAG: RDD family protein [Elusimicrobia bacterium]|nr:RDD family protein [Elusimicrobiota bacterium]